MQRTLALVRSIFRVAAALAASAGLACASAAAQSGTSAPIAIAEVNSPGAMLTLADVAHPDVVIPIHLVEREGRLVTVELSASPFTSGSGPGVVPSILQGDVAVKSITLKPRSMQRVLIAVRLLGAGNYRSLLRISITGRECKVLEPLPISVTRSLTSPAVEFAHPSAMPVEAPWFARKLSSTQQIAAYATGTGFTLPVPHLATATRKAAVDSGEASATTLVLSAARSASAPTSVLPGRVTQIPLSFDQIPGAGRYDVTIRFASAGYKPLDAKFALFVREPMGMAFLVIFIGVLISFSIQAWDRSIRPGLQNKERVARLLEQLDLARRKVADLPADVPARRLVGQIFGALQNLQGASWAKRLTSGGSLDLYEAIMPALPLWIDLREQLDRVRPVSVRDKHEATLDAARLAFTASAPDLAKVQAAIQSLEQMPDQIRADVGSELARLIAEFDEILAADPNAKLVAVRQRLSVAGSRLAAGQIEEALNEYDGGVRDYVSAMSAELERCINATTPPPGFSDAEWMKLRDSTSRELAAVAAQADVDVSLQQLRLATRVYQLGLVAGVRRVAEGFPDDLTAPLLRATGDVERALAEGNLVAAWAAMKEAQAAYEILLAANDKKLGPEEEAELATLMQLPGGGALDVAARLVLPASLARLGRPGTAKTIEHRRLAGDALLSAVVVVVAGLMGVQALWVPNPTWGGGASYLAALLWGFAADKLTHAGVAALRK